MSRRRTLAAALFACLATAAPASAGSVTIGNDLTAQATQQHSHPRDWAAWPNDSATGNAIVAPVQGEVSMAQFKGTILKPDNDAAYNGKYPDFVFHVVVLRPQPDGTLKLMVSTQNLPFPFGGDDQRITTFSLQQYDAKICVVPGDIVGLATSGGFGHSVDGGTFPDEFYADGYPVKMFSASRTGSYGLFEQAPGTDTFQVGDDVRSTTVRTQELLMRATISTARDARWWCRTKEEQAANLPAPGEPDPLTPAQKPGGLATIPPAPQGVLKVRGGKVKVPVQCAGPAACAGTLSMRHGGRAFGKAKFAVAPGATTTVVVKLPAAARKHFKADKYKSAIKALATTASNVTKQYFTLKRA
jgi:hypothetical protein